MIIGAGLGQVPAIETAHSMGLKALVIDRDPHAPGMGMADESASIDVTDIDAAIEVARSSGVRGALTMQSDLPVPTVGAVNDALGLSGVSWQVARRCSNKILARERFRAAGVPQPAFKTASTVDEAERGCDEVGYPCVVKAPDSSGSRGVVRVDSRGTVSEAFREARGYSREGRVLIERFVHGVEIGAQAFSSRGKCVAVHTHDDMVSTPPYMIPIGHAYPSSLSIAQRGLAQQAIADAVEALGIGDGPSNVDVILTDDGGIELLEVGARIGATCLPELTSLHIGKDWVEAAIIAAMGGTPNLQPRRSMPVAAFILESSRDGILKECSIPAEVTEDSRILEWEVTAKPGDQVSKLRKGTDRIGKIVTTGRDVHEAIRVADAARRQLSLDFAE